MADFKTDFHRFIALCNEEYLIQYANKGIYNRSLKDMEKGISVSYEFGDDFVECALSDDSVCRLHADISRFSCSCPSDKICKHVLIAIVYYRENMLSSDIPSQEVESYQPDFGWLLRVTPEQIAKAFSAAQIEEVLFRLEYVDELQIAVTSFLTVTMTTQKVIVTFEPDSEIAKTMCSCKSKGNCIHKLEALLRYRHANQIDDSASLQATTMEVSYDEEVVRETRELIQEVLGIGLAKLPNTICTRLELLAIAAHNGNLPNVETDIRGMSGDLSLFFQRHVQFSKEGLLERLTRIYLGLVALEKAEHHDQKKQLLGSFKSKYYTIPQLQLYSLGANPWETRSGYKGVTYYFFSLDDKRIYTYTEARPVYYEGNSFSYMNSYKGKSPWSDLVTMEELSRSQVVLAHPKTNREQRLSSSEDTELTLQQRLHIEDIDLGDTLLRDWTNISSLRRRDLFEQSTDTVFLVLAKKVSHVEFDDATQQLSITIEDDQGYSLELVITYQEKFARSLSALERNKRLLELRDVFILIQNIGDSYVPISFLQGSSLTSIKLDL